MANRQTDTTVPKYQPALELLPKTGEPFSTPNGSIASLQWLEEVVIVSTGSTGATLTTSKIPANSLFLGAGLFVLTPITTTATSTSQTQESFTISTPNIGAVLTASSTGSGAFKGTTNPVWIAADTNIQYNAAVAPTDATGTLRLSAWWLNFTGPSQ